MTGETAYFRDILGVPADASREQVRKAYRRLVMENHPDRFPAERKAAQDLVMITLTEAYSALMCLPRGLAAEEPAAGSRKGSPARGTALAPHRDPAYAYYKQGFINFSLAIHGIAEVNRKIAKGRVPRFTRRYTAAGDIAGSLSLLGTAHGYFSRVVEDHPGSVWGADALLKLRRIARFTTLYRKILTNL